MGQGIRVYENEQMRSSNKYEDTRSQRFATASEKPHRAKARWICLTSIQMEYKDEKHETERVSIRFFSLLEKNHNAYREVATFVCNKGNAI